MSLILNTMVLMFPRYDGEFLKTTVRNFSRVDVANFATVLSDTSLVTTTRIIFYLESAKAE
jgi:hypothetical protein